MSHYFQWVYMRGLLGGASPRPPLPLQALKTSLFPLPAPLPPPQAKPHLQGAHGGEGGGGGGGFFVRAILAPACRAPAHFFLRPLLPSLTFFLTSPPFLPLSPTQVIGSPTDADLADYAGLLSRLIAGGARVDEVHLYTYARPSPGGNCAPLDDGTLLRHSAFVRAATGLRVRAFGTRSELHPQSPGGQVRGAAGG